MKKLNLLQKFNGLTLKKKVAMIGGVVLVGLLAAPLAVKEDVTPTPTPPTPVKVQAEKGETEQEKVERIKRENEQFKINLRKEAEAAVAKENNQNEINKELRIIIEGIVKENMGDMYKGMEVIEGANIIKLSNDGLARDFMFTDKNSEARRNFRLQMTELSKKIKSSAESNGSNENYSIWILNDLNEDNVLMNITNGVIYYEFTNDK